MAHKIYHLTPHENTKSILKEGIKANEYGDIYVFTDMLVADTIAKNQIFTKRYSVFEINRKGIKVKLIPDQCAEFSQGFQRIIKQNEIDPKYLELIYEDIEIITNGLTEWDYLVYEHHYHVDFVDTAKRWKKFTKHLEQWKRHKIGKRPVWIEFLLGSDLKKINLLSDV